MEINLKINSSLKKMLSGLNSEEINKIIADSIITEAELDKLSKSKDIDRNVVLCAKAIANNSTSDASKNNQLCDSLKDFFANPKVQKVIDSSGDGIIDDKELTTYFSSIKGLDKNSGSLSVSDINLALSSINAHITTPTEPNSDNSDDKKLKEKLIEADGNLKQAWGDLKNSEKDMNAAVNKELQNNQDLAQYKSSYETVESNITTTNENIDETQTSIDTKNGEIETSIGIIEETKGDLVTNTQSQKDVQLEMDGIGTEIDGLNTQITAINNEPDKKDPDTGETIPSNKSGRIAKLNSQIENLERQSQRKQQKLDSLIGVQKDLEEKQKEEETNLDVLRSDLKDLEIALEDYNKARDGFVEERATILSNIQKCESVSKETKDAITSYNGVQQTYNSAKSEYDSAKKAYDATIKFTYIPKEKRPRDQETNNSGTAAV